MEIERNREDEEYEISMEGIREALGAMRTKGNPNLVLLTLEHLETRNTQGVRFASLSEIAFAFRIVKSRREIGIKEAVSMMKKAWDKNQEERRGIKNE